MKTKDQKIKKGSKGTARELERLTNHQEYIAERIDDLLSGIMGKMNGERAKSV